MNYRNPDYLDLARGHPCAGGWPGCDGGGETTVAAHSNLQEHGKGKSVKAHDCCVAFLCASCHDFLDRGPEPEHVKRLLFHEAMARTVIALHLAGRLQVVSPRVRVSPPAAKQQLARASVKATSAPASKVLPRVKPWR